MVKAMSEKKGIETMTENEARKPLARYSVPLAKGAKRC